jgi:ABC-type polysaccharide/polyol phosphate export permease
LLSWKVDSSLGAFEREIIDSLNSELNARISSARSNIDFFTEMIPVSPSLEERVEEIDSDLRTIGEMDTEFLIDPVWTDKKPVYEEGLKKSAAVAFIFPILALFVVLLLASTSVIYDKKTGFLTRVRSSTSPFLYLLAKLVFFTVLVFAQFLIIMVLFLLYGATYSYSFFSLLNIIVYIAVIDSLLGIIVGLISNNEGVAVLFSLIISFPLMLISGIFFPVQTLPRAVQYLTSVMPLNYQILASKSILLFNQGISNTWVYFAVVLFALVYWLIGRD